MEHLTHFKPVSPDPDINNLADQGLAKFGHLNALIDYIKDAPVYTSNAAALAGGLVVGDLYKCNPGLAPFTMIAIVV